MYSWQIDELLKNKNYVVNMDDYKQIIASSQIIHIKYEPFSDDFLVNTDDRFSWRFKVQN